MALIDDLECVGVAALDEREQVLVGEARQLGGQTVGGHSEHSTAHRPARITAIQTWASAPDAASAGSNR